MDGSASNPSKMVTLILNVNVILSSLCNVNLVSCEKLVSPKCQLFLILEEGLVLIRRRIFYLSWGKFILWQLLYCTLIQFVLNGVIKKQYPKMGKINIYFTYDFLLGLQIRSNTFFVASLRYIGSAFYVERLSHLATPIHANPTLCTFLPGLNYLPKLFLDNNFVTEDNR